MLVVIEKCEFFIRKTDFIRFIIKLGHIMGLYYQVIKVKRSYYRTRVWRNLSNSGQVN